jgi:hypothetical protein
MSKLLFSESAWEEYIYWQTVEPHLAQENSFLHLRSQKSATQISSVAYFSLKAIKLILFGTLSPFCIIAPPAKYYYTLFIWIFQVFSWVS